MTRLFRRVITKARVTGYVLQSSADVIRTDANARLQVFKVLSEKGYSLGDVVIYSQAQEGFTTTSRAIAEYGFTRAPEQRVSIRYFIWL